MHRNRPPKQTLPLFPLAVSFVVVSLSCISTSTPAPMPTPDPILPTVAALETALARHARDAGASAATLQAVAALETELAHQADQITTLYEGLSYLSTRVGAMPAPTRTTTPPTRTPPPPDLVTPTMTPVPVERFPSPDGSRVVLLQGRGTLIVQEIDSGPTELLVTGEISGLDWHPDGRHIVYSDRDLTQEAIARHDQLWIIDIETGERWQIGMGYAPRVSPDGRHIAVLSGVLWGDACFVGYDVAILELDGDMRVVGITHQDDFAGLPGREAEEERNASFYPVSTGDIPASGVWQSDPELAVGLRWTCTGPDDAQNGVYLLDLETLRASRIDELEAE